MKTFLFLIILQLLLSPVVNSALALYPSGSINDDIYYSDLEITYIRKKKVSDSPRPPQKKPKLISGCLNNRTDKAIYFKATLVFNDFFNRPTAKADIKKSIPAFGKASFQSKISLKKEKFSDFNLEWQIKMPRNRKLTSFSKPAKEKKACESLIRVLDSGLQITGQNSVITDTFRLKKGICSFRANIIGKKFTAYLNNKSTNKKIRILSQTGKYSRTEKINIDEEGFYNLKVAARGSWRIEIKFFNAPRAESTAVENGSTGGYIIYLKNGKTITAEQLKIDENIASFISSGTKISISKDNILKTELAQHNIEEPSPVIK